MANKKDLDKASQLVGMGDFQNMLEGISGAGNKPAAQESKQETGKATEAVKKDEEPIPAKAETKAEDVTETEAAPAEAKEEEKKEEKKDVERKTKKKKASLDDFLVARKNNNGPNISLVVPVAVRDFLNLLKDMSPENTAMVNILANIVEDFKDNYREEITERIKKMNEDKLNSF